MPTKKSQRVPQTCVPDAPETLDDHVFFGLRLDEDQTKLRDAIYRGAHRLFFVNGAAGTGKNLVAIATSILLVQYGLFNKIIYARNTGEESKLGYLPGGIADKTALYSAPCAQAMLRIGVDPSRYMTTDGLVNTCVDKQDDGFIHVLSTAYLRGTNLGDEDDKTIVILDEAQNYTVHDLQMMLTRVNDAGLTIVLGCESQIDLPDKTKSGFMKYIRHFEGSGLSEYYKLTHSHRGKIAEWADKIKD